MLFLRSTFSFSYVILDILSDWRRSLEMFIYIYHYIMYEFACFGRLLFGLLGANRRQFLIQCGGDTS